jgi:O-antigen/teichoic acid export membrane protein
LTAQVTSKTFWKNFFLLMINNILSPVFSTALVVVISRFQGLEVMGKYALMTTVLILGQNCISLGFPILITRETAKLPLRASQYYISSCVVSLGLLSIILLFICPTLWLFVEDTEMQISLQFVLLSLIPSIFTIYAEAVLLGLEKTEGFIFVTLIENILRVVSSTFFVFFGYGIVSIAIIILILRTASCLFLINIMRRNGVKPTVRINFLLCKELLQQIPVLGSIPIVNALYSRADVLLITWMRGLSEVGLYGASTRLVDLARLFPQAYGRALYPLISRLYSQRHEAFQQAFINASRTLLLVMFCMAIILSGLADYFIGWLYGSTFQEAAVVLRLLAWTIVPYSLACILAQILFSTDNQVLDLRVNIIATLVSIGLNLLVIPVWGGVGAACVSMISMTLYASIQYFYVSTRIVNPSLIPTFVKIGLVGLGGWSTIILALFLGWNPFLVGCMGISVYVFGLLGSGTVTQQDFSAAYMLIESIVTRK